MTPAKQWLINKLNGQPPVDYEIRASELDGTSLTCTEVAKLIEEYAKEQIEKAFEAGRELGWWNAAEAPFPEEEPDYTCFEEWIAQNNK